LALALAGSYLVAFADPARVTLERLLPAALGAGAALLWALGTVLALLALVPGLAALLLYYRGLRRTAASTATLAELAFPVTALAVNAVAFGTVLGATQLAGAALLASTVTALGMADGRGGSAVGVRQRLGRMPAPEMSRA